MAPQKIVVRYNDGRVLKGHTSNFNPTSSHFHLAPVGQPGAKPVAVELRQLKAVFFVRDFAGNPRREDRAHFVEGQTYKGHKVRVQFKDGEIMLGYTPGYDSGAPGFFVFPADPESNTLKVFAVATSVVNVTLL